MILDDTNNQQPETTPEPVEQPQPEKQEPVYDERESIKEQNIRQLRLQAERAEYEAHLRMKYERENEELKRKLSQPQSNYDSELESDELLDKRSFKKYHSSYLKEAETFRKKTEELEKREQQRDRDFAELSARTRFPNYYEVVNDKNLERLSKMKPELYESIMANSNTKNRMIAAYEAINASINTKSYETQDNKIAENKAKPKAVSSVPSQQESSPLASFRDDGRIRVSEEEAKELRRQMAEYSKRRQ